MVQDAFRIKKYQRRRVSAPDFQGRALLTGGSDHRRGTLSDRISDGRVCKQSLLTGDFNHDRGFDTFLKTTNWEITADEDVLDKVDTLARAINKRLSEVAVHDVLKRGYERFLNAAER